LSIADAAGDDDLEAQAEIKKLRHKIAVIQIRGLNAFAP
jgi:hypothetical protein